MIDVASGTVMMVGSDLLERRLNLDDAVGAIPVHGFCEAVGTILTRLLATTEGLFYTGSWNFFGVQVLGAFTIALWGFVDSFIIFLLLKKVMGLRVSEEEEIKGLDLSERGESAYSEFLLKDEA